MLTNTRLFVNERKYFLADNKKGFTLVELVVVIAIMSVLALIIVPSVSSYIEKAERARAEITLKKAYTAVEMVRLVDGVVAPRWSSTSTAHDSEFIKLFKEYTNLDENTKIMIFASDMTKKNAGTVRMWYEVRDGRRVKAKNGRIYLGYDKHKPNSPEAVYNGGPMFDLSDVRNDKNVNE